MYNKTIRPYEMSVWTLRDRYLATLKVPDIENKGHIEDPRMTLNIDGTQELEFKVPMYYSVNGKLAENPRWYDVQNGLLMRGLRKIKVIFTEEDKVFEFLITDIEEEHGNDGSLYCSVKGSGLAFQELGKKGYKISLSSDDYLNDCLEFDEKIREDSEKYEWTAEQRAKQEAKAPINNINYWCDKVFAKSDWYYTIQMDWGNYDGFVYFRIIDPDGTAPFIGSGRIGSDEEADEQGIITSKDGAILIISSAQVGLAQADITKVEDPLLWPHEYVSYFDLTDDEKAAVNNLRESLNLRRNDVIYEDDYVTSWITDDEAGILTPLSYEKYREKYRQVDAAESNIYNITQTIAETFGVYCKYKYHYDDNHHIIKKEVIFYNNFSDELNGTIDLTYPYNSSSIKRTLDNNDLCTKLFVPSVDDSSAPDGIYSIMNTPANPSGEDYLLNFDYLYKTNSIDEDQYRAISEYEYQMKNKNIELKELSEAIIKLEEDKVEQEAIVTVTNNTLAQVVDQISRARSGIASLTSDESGTIKNVIISSGLTREIVKEGEQEKTNWYLLINKDGAVKDDDFKIFKQKDAANNLNDEYQGEMKFFDENGQPFDEEKSTFITRVQVKPTDAEENLSAILWYIQCNLRPTLYYQNIIDTYQLKGRTELNRQQNAIEALDTIEENLKEDYEAYDKLLEEKQAIILDFEKMMGPALREGNWRPEEYQDYGDKYSTEIIVPNNENNDLFIWDNEPFDEEQLGYYEVGVNLQKVYYPCVDISNHLEFIADKIGDNDKLCYKYEETYDSTLVYVQEGDKWYYQMGDTTIEGSSKAEVEEKILKYYLTQIKGDVDLSKYTSYELYKFRKSYGLSYTEIHYFNINSTMKFGFLRKEGTQEIIPVLVLTGAENVFVPYGKTLLEVISNNAALCTVEFEVQIDDLENNTDYLETWLENNEMSFSNYNSLKTSEVIGAEESISSQEYIIDYGNNEYEYVYPRICIPNLGLKTSSDQFSIEYKINSEETTYNELLDSYYDYNFLIRDDSYYITLSPERLVDKGQFNKKFRVKYVISNAELNIYLDAREVLKSNSQPQVSYEIDVSIVNEDFIKTAYRQLNRLAHINDHDLKFENVVGYVSNLDLDLDHPWEDSIEIKNYKTKFEDLFTKIVASTESMKANSAIYDRAASAFDSTGQIKSDVIQQSLQGADFNIKMNEGKLVIDSVQGIQALSDDGGIVMFSGGGIYCATETDDDGNWKWTTGISPEGINASLIKTGQLDTNLIRIFSGDDLSFQMNGDGLFAYRHPIREGGNEDEYVVHNGEGLFLVNRNVEVDGEEIDINRVEVSWDGFIIRNLNNEEVFYADDEGNLTLAGTIEAADGLIGGWLIKENTLMSNPDEAEDSNVRSTGMASGSFIDEETGITNILNESTDLYKVFWVGDETDRNHFYVDSTGVVNASSVIVDNSLIASKIVLDGILLNDVIKEVRENAGSISVVNLTSDTFYYTEGDEPDEDELRFALVSSTGIELTSGGSLTFYYLEYDIQNPDEPEPEIGSDNTEEDDNNEIDTNSQEEGEEEEEPIIVENWIYLPPEETFDDGDTGEYTLTYYTIEGIVNDHYLTFSINSDIISLMAEDSNILTLKAVYGIYEVIFNIYVRDERKIDNLLVNIVPLNGNNFEFGKEDLYLKARLYKNGRLINDEEAANYHYQWYCTKNNETSIIEEANTSILIINAETDGAGTYSCTVEGG